MSAVALVALTERTGDRGHSRPERDEVRVVQARHQLDLARELGVYIGAPAQDAVHALHGDRDACPLALRDTQARTGTGHWVMARGPRAIVGS